MTKISEGVKQPRKKREGNELIQYEKLTQGVYAITYQPDKANLKYDKETLIRYLETDNEEKLREASNYFLRVSGQYRRLVSYFANILTFDHLIVPRFQDSEILKRDELHINYKKVLLYADNSYIKETSRYITFCVIVDGVFYGYERNLKDITVLQQLPPSHCRSKYKIDGVYAVEFNLKFFDSYRDTSLKMKLFDLFPEEFLEYYNDFKAGKIGEWVQLDPKFARCHKLYDSPRPLMADVLPDIVNLKEYQEIDKAQSKMDLYKLIVQKIPIDKNTGEPTIELEESRALHRNAKKMITQNGIDVLTTPLDVEAINLQERGQTIRDNIERANDIVYNSAGTPSMLFNSDKGGSIGLSNSIKTDESMMFPLLDQYKRWYELRFKRLINNKKKYWFEVLMPEITIFNRKEMFDLYKEGATLGYSKLMLLMPMGLKQTTFMNLIEYENEYIDITNKLIPLETSYAPTRSDKGGRPQSDEGSLSEKGIEQRERESNKNRAK